MESLIQYAPGCDVVKTLNSKTGAHGVRLQTAAEYRKAMKLLDPKLTNKEIKRDWFAYLRKNAKVNTAQLAAEMAGGNLGVRGMSLNKDETEMQVKFVFLDKIGATDKAEVEASLNTMKPEELQAMMEKIKALLPVEDTTGNHVGEQ